jgi:hypothetical protein
MFFFGNLNQLLGYKVRGFAPIGMLEFWNIGIMGYGIME